MSDLSIFWPNCNIDNVVHVEWVTGYFPPYADHVDHVGLVDHAVDHVVDHVGHVGFVCHRPRSATCWPCWPCSTSPSSPLLRSPSACHSCPRIGRFVIWASNDDVLDFDILMLDADKNNTNDLVTPKRFGCTRGSSPGWCLSSRCLSPDPSGGRFFYLLSLFYFCLILMFSLAFSGYCFCLNKLNRSEIGISISDCCQQRNILVCETIVFQKCVKYIYVWYTTKLYQYCYKKKQNW